MAAMMSCKNTVLCLQVYGSVFEKLNENLLHFMVLDTCMCSGVCNACTGMKHKCSSSHKLIILLHVSSCYCFGAGDIVSVVRSIVLSRVSSHSCETFRELLPYRYEKVPHA